MYKYVMIISSLVFSILVVLNFQNKDFKNTFISILLAFVCLIISKKLNKNN